VNNTAPIEEQIWHEICRPQVHGYDLNQAVFLSPLKFISVADEKVARVFEAPKSFVSLAKHYGILEDTIDEVTHCCCACYFNLTRLSGGSTGRRIRSSTRALQ
jgi:hypothetical protein